MVDRSEVLPMNLASLAEARRERQRVRSLAADRTLPTLVADFVAARTAVCVRQGIERYALAVGAFVEIRVRAER